MGIALFDTTLTPSAFTTPDNVRMTLALGIKTIVYYTATQSLTFIGLAAIGGNFDGMVVCFSNRNTSAFSLSFAHESGSEAVTTNRLNNVNLATASCLRGGALWFRFNGVAGRWQHIGTGT